MFLGFIPKNKYQNEIPNKQCISFEAWKQTILIMENSPRNAHLQPSFPSDDNIKAKDVQEHVQHVELKPGQRY